MSLTPNRVLDWLIPALLVAALGLLGWMGETLSQISRTLAVAVSKIDDHERRILNIEGIVFRPIRGN